MQIHDMTLDQIEYHVEMRRKQASLDLMQAIYEDINLDLDYSEYQLERGADVPKMEI